MERVVRPEQLDELDSDDPRAMRSRADLRRINRVMGNLKWLREQVARLHESGLRRVIELGAGDGVLARLLVRDHPELQLTAIDLHDPPFALHEHPRISWMRGDVMSLPLECCGAVVISNLFLHHLESLSLRRLGDSLGSASALLACEPQRRVLHLWQARMAAPLVNSVTRHDMRVSIQAGFRGDDLIKLLALPGDWAWEQRTTWWGSHRLKGVRA